MLYQLKRFANNKKDEGRYPSNVNNIDNVKQNNVGSTETAILWK